MATIRDIKTAFEMMYQNEYDRYERTDSRQAIYNKIRDFCYRNGIQVEARSVPMRSMGLGYSRQDYGYVSDYPEFDLRMRFELLAKIVCDLEEMDTYVRMKEKETAMLESNPELAEMYEKYLTFKALCEQKK